MPLLSIIIPHYNHNERLRLLLENILEQTMRDIEVVVADDCSEVSCMDIVEEYREKGLNIVFVQNAKREYTKNTRLNGVEAASGRLLTCMDADDRLYKREALAYHVQKQLETDVDILHFASRIRKDGKVLPVSETGWGQPLVEGRIGDALFNHWVLGGCRKHTLWGKIAKRELWAKCLPAARASSVRRYMEDFFFTSLLFFHAQSYFGSSRVGYAYDWIIKDEEKSFGRAVTSYHMLKEFVPYIERLGVDPIISGRFQSYVLDQLHTNITRFCRSRQKEHAASPLADEALLREMLQHGDAEVLVKVLMTGLL